MANQQFPAAVSVSFMAELCLLSRSRFYELMGEVFPEPVRSASSKRPVYDRELIEKCLEIRRTGIGMDGQPVLFNRKRPANGSQIQQQKEKAVIQEHTDLVEALKSLQLTTTSEAVDAALRDLYPSGSGDVDQGEVVRQVFLYLQKKS